MQDGKCRMWGNPVAEMMYETLRYFTGLGATSAYTKTFGSDIEDKLGLKRAAWSDPYAGKKFPTCAKPFQTVIADINNSYDSDQLPGSKFKLEDGSEKHRTISAWTSACSPPRSAAKSRASTVSTSSVSPTRSMTARRRPRP